MKTLLLILTLSLVGFGQTTAITKDGKSVILNSDGTWQYAPPSKDIDGNLVTIYLYRLKEPGIYNRGRDIKLDGKELLELGQDKFIGIKIAPGKHSIQTNRDDSALTIETEAGRRYFLFLLVGTGGFFQTHIIKEMATDQAILELKKTSVVSDKQIKAKDIVFIKEKP